MTNEKKHILYRNGAMISKGILCLDVAALFMANLPGKIFLPILFASGILYIGFEIGSTVYYNKIQKQIVK